MPTPDPKPTKPSSRKAPAAGAAGDPKRTATDASATPAKRAKAPAAKPAETTAEAPAAVRRRTARKPAAKSPISDQERRHLIAVAAYYIAERGGFASGSPHDHWIEAEREIDAMIAAGLPG